VNKWLLKNTLRRKIESRPIEQSDLKYAYAAYKKGVMGAMGFADGMDAPAFRAAFEHYVMNNAQAAWVISTDNKNGFRPNRDCVRRLGSDGGLPGHHRHRLVPVGLQAKHS
jgi:hypothetical protein